MRLFFKRPDRQRGLVLLIILIIVVLGSLTVLVSNLSYTDIQIAKQRQTMLALAQAKAALLGFAASYAETHPGQPVGYLPCPDQTGDGSVDVGIAGTSPCSDKGKTVLGRFPWRTLGLPPLRDGDGECLWYAVSGNYKDTPKKTLTSDTDGRFIVQDVNGRVIAGSSPENRAIAIIFSPGKPLGNQVRGGSSGTATECGRESAPADDINQASNYLEQVTIGGNYIISNHEGAVYTFTSVGTKNYLGVTHTGIVDANGTSEPAITPFTPDFAATNRIFRNNQMNCDTQELQACRSIFVTGSSVSNDTLMLITPEDYKSIYTRMDWWVAKKATDCISRYVQANETSYFTKYATTIGEWDAPASGTYRKAYETDINRYADLKEMQLRAKLNEEGRVPTTAEITAERDKAIKNAIDIEKKYPWAATVDDVDDTIYADAANQRFGRVPTTLSNVGEDMGTAWPNTFNPPPAPYPPPFHPGNCFNESNEPSTPKFQDYEWSWWDEWKKMVFYAINEKNTSGGIHIWVKLEATRCHCSTLASNSNCKENIDKTNECWQSWVAALADSTEEITDADADLMKMQNLNLFWTTGTDNVEKTKQRTFAKMQQNTTTGEWEWQNDSTSMSSSSGVLNVDGNTANFIVLVAGRSLSLSSYPQIRDPTLNNSGWFWIKNYLEDDNIPGAGEVDTIPSGDETFVRKPIASSFNDVVCMNGSWNCVIP